MSVYPYYSDKLARVLMIIYTFLMSLIFGSMIARAAQDEPWKSWQWQRLLYMKSEQSIVDGDKFFLSQDRTPKAEWDALKKFVMEARGTSEVPCRFPARTKFLRQRLGASPYDFKHCLDYQAFLKEVKANQVSLVFPSAYFGDPASLFGHALLKFDQKGREALLGYGVSFGAQITDSPGVTYAIKGVFGLYPGYFSIVPFYEAINLYNDMEDRDLWVMPLNVSAEKVATLLDHLWEMQLKRINYYFFTENCAKLLIDFLGVVEPSIDPKSFSSRWVLPIDVVNHLNGAGLIVREEFRPSLSQSIHYQFDELAEDSKSKFPFSGGIQGTSYQSLDRREDAKILNIWADLIRYQFRNGDIDRRQYASQYIETLKLRSQTDISTDQRSSQSPPYSMLSGHYPRIIGLGVSQGGETQYLRLRPALHAADDSSLGHNPNMILSVLDSKIYLDKGELSLDELIIVHLANWGAYTRVLPSYSWEVLAEYRKLRSGIDLEFLVGRAEKWGSLMGMVLTGVQSYFRSEKVQLSPMVLGRIRQSLGSLYVNLELRYIYRDEAELTAAVAVGLPINRSYKIGIEAKQDEIGSSTAVEMIYYF